MYCLALLIWWFAIIDQQGKIVYLEYVLHRDCKAQESLYKRIPTLTVTKCQQKEPA